MAELLESREYLSDFANFGFESPDVGGGLLQNPVSAGWTFAGDSGVADGAYCYAQNLDHPPVGDQIGVLKSGGAISQAINLDAGVYRLVFQCRETELNSFKLRVDGVELNCYVEYYNGFNVVTTDSTHLAAGSHTFSFHGLGVGTAYLDDVRVEQGLLAPSATSSVTGWQVNLSWANLPADAYGIMRSVNGGTYEELWIDGQNSFSGVTQAIDLGVSPGTVFSYRMVDSTGRIGDAAYVTTACGSEGYVWPAPSASLVNGERVYLTWDMAGEWHNVERSTDGIHFEPVYWNGTNCFYGQNFIYDAGLQAYTTYYYRVISSTGWISGATAITTGVNGSDAINASATMGLDNLIVIAWSPTTSPCRVQKSTDGLSFNNLSVEGVDWFTGGSVIDADVTPGSVYYYHVISSDGNSSRTLVVDGPVTLEATASAVSSFEATINWNAQSNFCRVQRSVDSVNFVDLASGGTTELMGVTSMSDSGLLPRKTYYYRVQASNGQFSDVIDVTTPSYTFAAPTLDADYLYRAVIAWAPVPLAEHYHIVRSTDRVHFSRLSILGTDELFGTGAVDTTARPGTTYYYRVVVSLPQGNMYSATSSALTLNSNPSGNTPPVAYEDKHYVVLHDRPLSVPAGKGLLANDGDVERDNLQAIEQTITSTNHGTVAIRSDGSFVYIPPAYFYGTDTFTYQVSDGCTFSSSQATIRVVETAPSTLDDRYWLHHDSPLSRNVITNDYDPRAGLDDRQPGSKFGHGRNSHAEPRWNICVCSNSSHHRPGELQIHPF